MIDATTQSHRHAHDHPVDSAPARPLSAGPSLLELSAGARLWGLSLLIGLVWAGVYWALH